MYILVVDDDPFANTLVQFVLSKEGHEVEAIDNAHGAMHLIQRRPPDLLLLDIGLPSMNGFELSAKLRAEGYEIPLMFITALDTVEAKMQGFERGADDYLCKPYDHQELVARVEAVLRRLKNNGQGRNQRLHCGLVELFPGELKGVVAGRMITLTPTEMKVLRALMSTPGQTITRTQLLAEVWNDQESDSNIVDVYIRRLRVKLEGDQTHPRHIFSTRGVGYRFLGQTPSPRSSPP